MTTHRERIMQAVVTALNTDRPDGVPSAERSRVLSLEGSLPAIVLYPIKEDVERMGQLAKRSFALAIDCTAEAPVDGEPVDAQLDAMLAWLTRALAGSRLGGLAQDTQELGVAWDIEARDSAFGRATATFGIRYVTPINDQTAR